MKKIYMDWKDDEQGFFLPYTIMISTIIFILLTAYLIHYQNELKITENNLEQVQLETLLRMGYQTFWLKRDYLKENETKFFYQFPNGEVEITKAIIHPGELGLTIKALTKQQSVYYLWRRESYFIE